ncbi:MAG: TIGR02147 family protein [Proteobacteria bacterium]|nr:TIGR02147 family protein [Pseudomonadota bacterium]
MATRRPPGSGPLVFDFTDYRAYLRAHYEAEKKRRAGFSFRLFSRLAGLRSPNFLKLVIDGQRNLGDESIPKFVKALGLNAAEGAFFADLVAFNQAPDAEQRNRAFERIAGSRRFRAARRIEGELFAYLSCWYHPVIRELAARADFRDEPKWIAAQLRPRIAPTEAAASLKLLLSLGLLVRDAATGRLQRAEPTLTTEHEVGSLAAGNFHRQMLERAAAAIETVPAHERDLAALTVCVSARTVAAVKERIHRLREELAELCDGDPAGERVYQLNLQWFPLSAGRETKP